MRRVRWVIALRVTVTETGKKFGKLLVSERCSYVEKCLTFILKCSFVITGLIFGEKKIESCASSTLYQLKLYVGRFFPMFGLVGEGCFLLV